MVPESENPIHVYRDRIPKKLRGKLEIAEHYQVNQGARAQEHLYDIEGQMVPANTIKFARQAAEKDSNSDKLHNKALDMAIDQIVQKALPDYERLGVVAISDIEIENATPTVHEIEGGCQGALTLNVSANGYKYRRA